jgi:hypothetical protein
MTNLGQQVITPIAHKTKVFDTPSHKVSGSPIKLIKDYGLPEIP